MSGWYGVLKVVHVLSVVVWIGGATALAFVTAGLLRTRDRATLNALLQQSIRYGHTMGGPVSVLVLLTGIAMVAVGRIGFGTFWVTWGFAGIVAHFLFGAVVMRRRNMALESALAATPTDEARIAAAGQRLRVGTLIYLLLMMSVIVVMVWKPTL